MTHHEEEQKLRRDAEAAERGSEQVGQMQLNEAVRAGIGRGKKRAARRKTLYGAGLVTAAAAAVIAFSSALMPGMGGEPAQQNVTAGVQEDKDKADPASAPEDAAGTGYETIDSYGSNGTDLKFSDALRGGYVASLGESKEENGYTVTLKGAAMDDRSMYMIVSLKNDTPKKARLSQVRVDFGQEYPVTWLSMNSDTAAPGAVRNFFIEYQLGSKAEYPEKASFHTEVYSGEFGQPEGKTTNFDIPFEINTQELADKTRTVEVARELETGGQKIRIERIELSPLATYVDYRYADTNDKKIFSLLDPRLQLSGDSGSETPLLWKEDESEDGVRTMTFAGSKLQDVESAKLSIEGVSAIEPEKLKLVVNTDTGKIIQGGDDTLSVIPDKEKNTVTFRRELESTGEEQGLSRPTEFENVFTDAAGKVHNWTGPIEGYAEDSGGKHIESLVYQLYDSAIAQPVTLTMKNYWSPIKDPAEIELLTPVLP